MSRYYLNHRFSDDLDFFVNDDKNYGAYVDAIYARLKEQPQWQVLTAQTVRSLAFVRLVIRESDADLQNDFVNDIPYRVGKPHADLAPCLIDSWENIVSNKLSAATRFAAKDMVDLVFLARAYPFSWNDMLAQAKEKTGGLQADTIAQIMTGMPAQELEKIHWIEKPDLAQIILDLGKIADDLAYGRENSLHH